MKQIQISFDYMFKNSFLLKFSSDLNLMCVVVVHLDLYSCVCLQFLIKNEIQSTHSLLFGINELKCKQALEIVQHPYLNFN